MNGITIEGKSIDSFIDVDGLKKVYSDSIKGRIIHVPSSRNYQTYDREPGPVINITKEVLMKERDRSLTSELKPYREKVLERMREELKLDQPNKSLLFCGLMLQGVFISAKESSQMLQQFCEENGSKLTVSKSLTSNCMFRWRQGDKPIQKYIQKQGDAQYRFHPLLAKLALVDVMELCKTKGMGKFSERSLQIHIPELKDYQPSSNGKVDTLPSTSGTDHVRESVPTDIRVRVEFGPIRVIFGIKRD